MKHKLYVREIAHNQIYVDFDKNECTFCFAETFGTYAERKESAELIAHCVNSHDELTRQNKLLREALESVCSYFDTEDEGSHVCDYSIKLENRMTIASEALKSCETLENV